MEPIQWLDLLGWDESHLEDLRFVGYAYVKQGSYDIALKFFEALVLLSNNNPYDLQTLGAIYLQGDNVKALNYLERALQQDNSHIPSKLNKVKALILLGYRKQAILLAKELTNVSDEKIAQEAQALLLAYNT